MLKHFGSVEKEVEKLLVSIMIKEKNKQNGESASGKKCKGKKEKRAATNRNHGGDHGLLSLSRNDKFKAMINLTNGSSISTLQPIELSVSQEDKDIISLDINKE